MMVAMSLSCVDKACTVISILLLGRVEVAKVSVSASALAKSVATGLPIRYNLMRDVRAIDFNCVSFLL